MYNEEKLTKLRALKQLAERIDRDFADKASMAALAGRVDSAAAVISSIERAMYQAPAPARFWVELAGGLEQTVGALLGEEGLAGLTPSGTDGEGNSLYDFVVNDVTVGSYTSETALSQIAADISASQAGVEAAWDQEAGRVLFSAKVSGPSGRIEMGEGLAQAIFDPDWSEEQGGGSASSYTPGQDGVFTAIKVNGAVQEAIGQAVDIRVPVKVSDLTNDQKFQTEAEVAAAVAAADHLQRKKVGSLEEIDPAAPGADKFIYMVPKASSKNGDKYDEYMVLDGAVEPGGDWKVDLSGYVVQEEGKGLSSNDYTDEEKAKLAGLEIASDSEVAEMLSEVFGAAG